MPHFPKPFFKERRGIWYVEIDRKQYNLGPDKDQAFEQASSGVPPIRERKARNPNEVSCVPCHKLATVF